MEYDDQTVIANKQFSARVFRFRARFFERDSQWYFLNRKTPTKAEPPPPQRPATLPFSAPK